MHATDDASTPVNKGGTVRGTITRPWSAAEGMTILRCLPNETTIAKREPARTTVENGVVTVDVPRFMNSCAPLRSRRPG